MRSLSCIVCRSSKNIEQQYNDHETRPPLLLTAAGLSGNQNLPRVLSQVLDDNIWKIFTGCPRRIGDDTQLVATSRVPELTIWVIDISPEEQPGQQVRLSREREMPPYEEGTYVYTAVPFSHCGEKYQKEMEDKMSLAQRFYES